MSGRYVPPGRRASGNAAGEKPPFANKNDSLLSFADIREHFWPTIENDAPSLSDEKNSKTMHDSASSPGKLAYILLFHLANPRWEDDHIIFTKSSLDLLPAGRADDKGKGSTDGGAELSNEVERHIQQGGSAHTQAGAPESDMRGSDVKATTSDGLQAVSGAPAEPIAVFKQVGPGKDNRCFEFEGWYQIEKIAFLEPESAELVRMLEQKWTRKDKFGRAKEVPRDEARWKASLSYRWAVLRFEKDEIAEEDRGPPKIERVQRDDLDGPARPKKSVNELLAELRMGDAESTNGQVKD